MKKLIYIHPGCGSAFAGMSQWEVNTFVGDQLVTVTVMGISVLIIAFSPLSRS